MSGVITLELIPSFENKISICFKKIESTSVPLLVKGYWRFVFILHLQ